MLLLDLHAKTSLEFPRLFTIVKLMLGSITTLTAFFGVVGAQFVIPELGISITNECANAILGILSSPEANTCLSTSTIQSQISSTQNISTGFIDIYNAWSSSVCSSHSTTCSNTTLANIVANVTSGCRVDFRLESDNNVKFQAEGYSLLVQNLYPSVKNIVCLKDGTTNTNCITQTLQNIQQYIGSNTGLQTILSYIENSTLEAIPSNITCTDCVKAAYSILKKGNRWVLDYLPLEFFPSFPDRCGANFTNGKMPPNVNVSFTAANSTNGTGDGSNSGDSSNGTNGGSTTIGMKISALGVASLVTVAFLL